METFRIEITQALKGTFWYSGCVGQVFNAVKVGAKFHGHQRNHELFEVVGGEHDGEFMLPADCEVLEVQLAMAV